MRPVDILVEKMNISKWAPVSSAGKNAECQCSLLRIPRATPRVCNCCVWRPRRWGSIAAAPVFQNRTEPQGSRHFTARKGRVSVYRTGVFSDVLSALFWLEVLPLLQRPGSASATQQQRFDLKSVSFCCLSLCHSLVFIMSFIHVRIYLLLVQFSTLSHWFTSS